MLRPTGVSGTQCVVSNERWSTMFSIQWEVGCATMSNGRLSVPQFVVKWVLLYYLLITFKVIFYFHRYLRLQIPEVGGMIVASSDHRHATMEKMKKPESVDDVINILGDQSDKEFTIFRESGDDDFVKTVAVGKQFYIYLKLKTTL